MGCGGSKSELAKDEGGQKLPPILRRRFLEIRGRVRHAAGRALSEKELLKEGRNEDHEQVLSQFRSIGDDNDNNHRQSTCSLEEISSVSRAVKVTPEAAEAAAEPEGTGGAVTDIKNEEKKFVEETQRGENETDCKDYEEEEDGDGDDDSRDSNVQDDRLGPSSPSFRVYCVDSSDNGKDEDYGKEDDDTSQSQISQGDIDCGEIIANGTSGMEAKEKGEKGRKFRISMRKGRKPGPIKSLMNVASCYHASSSRHDKAHLLASKREPTS